MLAIETGNDYINFCCLFDDVNLAEMIYTLFLQIYPWSRSKIRFDVAGNGQLWISFALFAA